MRGLCRERKTDDCVQDEHDLETMPRGSGDESYRKQSGGSDGIQYHERFKAHLCHEFLWFGSSELGM